MDPISVRQYDKIFKSQSPDLISTSSRLQTAVGTPSDRLHASLVKTVTKILTLKLDDEEFDDPQINTDNLESYSTEILYGVLTKKFSRMVRLVQEREDDFEKIIEENQKLKQQFSEAVKYSEGLFKETNETVQQLLEANTKISNENNLGKADIQNMQTLLIQREEEIEKIKTSQRKVIDEFVNLRAKQQEMIEKSNEFKSPIAELRNEDEEKQSQIADYEKVLFEKQKGLEDLIKQRKVLETRLKQHALKLNNLVTELKKKNSMQEKTLDEYKRKLERNSVFVKRLAEIDREKEAVNEELAQKTAELNHVRAINQDFENRVEELRGIENYNAFAREKHYKLLTEAEIIKQQINELAPRSLLDVTPQHKDLKPYIPAGEKSSAEKNKKGDSIPDEEIEALKQQLRNNQAKIDELEGMNNERIQMINGQRKALSDKHAEYTDKIQTFNLVRADCEDALAECNQLEKEMELLSRRFSHLADILGTAVELRGSPKTSEKNPRSPSERSEGRASPKRTLSQDDNVPKPDQLYVSPIKEERASLEKESGFVNQQDENSSDDEANASPTSYLRKKPQSQKPELKASIKSPKSNKKHR